MPAPPLNYAYVAVDSIDFQLSVEAATGASFGDGNLVRRGGSQYNLT